MNKTKPTLCNHTPGPWITTAGVVRAKHDVVICKISQYNSKTGKANAALIASAPELLEAVREASDYFHDFIESDYDEMRLATIMRTAIKKAQVNNKQNND